MKHLAFVVLVAVLIQLLKARQHVSYFVGPVVESPDINTVMSLGHVAYDLDRNLLYAYDTTNLAIVAINTTSNTATVIAGFGTLLGIGTIYGMAVDPKRNRLYFSDSALKYIDLNEKKVYWYSAQSANVAVTAGSHVKDNALNCQSLAFDSLRNTLYVACTGLTIRGVFAVNTDTNIVSVAAGTGMLSKNVIFFIKGTGAFLNGALATSVDFAANSVAVDIANNLIYASAFNAVYMVNRTSNRIFQFAGQCKKKLVLILRSPISS